MSDETPAGPPEPGYGGGPPPEYPAQPWMQPPQVRPPRDPQATSRGIRAAVIIFFAAVALHLLLLAYVKLWGVSQDAWLFLPEGMLVMVVGLIAAIVVTVKLPQDSRGPFWLAGIACMFASVTVWAVTCAVAL